MILNFKIGPNGKEPVYSTPGAAGADIFAAEDIMIPVGESAEVRTELFLEIPEGFEGQVRPRSGLAFRRGVIGFFGTIDSDYRGEIKIKLTNNIYIKTVLDNNILFISPILSIACRKAK